jgi:hypothetical protein
LVAGAAQLDQGLPLTEAQLAEEQPSRKPKFISASIADRISTVYYGTGHSSRDLRHGTNPVGDRCRGCVLTDPEVADHIASAERDYSLRDIFPYALERDARSELMSLRLVSRNFCAAASRHLFKHIEAPTNSSSVRGQKPLLSFVKISRSKYAAHVRHLETGYNRWSSDRSGSLGQDIQDLAGLLSPCLAQLSDLRVLRFRASCESLTRDHEGTAIKAIVTVLRYVVLPRLEGLELFSP